MEYQGIYLIGFMGSGKTTVGKKLAKILDYPFIDLDLAVEQKTKKSIQNIFLKEGEEYFRKWEQQLLFETMNQKAVIATGGGIVLNSKNRSFLTNQKNVFFLEKSVSNLLQHLQTDKMNIRPLIATKTSEEIIEIYQQRIPFYYQVQPNIVVIDNETPDFIANKIKQMIENEGS